MRREKLAKAVKSVKKRNLSDFFDVYGTILELVATRVHNQVARGEKFTPSHDIAVWVAHDLPTMFKAAFGRVPKALKTWRMLTMMANANFLGAYKALDIVAVRGRGLTTVVKPRMRVIKGGKT